MKTFIYCSAAFLIVHLTCSAGDIEPKNDADLVALLSDSSSLSLADAIAMESYMREIRMWLMLRQELAQGQSFVETKKIVANRTADEIARVAELIHRLERNDRLTISLELDTSSTRRHLTKALREKLGPEDLEDLKKSDAFVQHESKLRADKSLPKLRFRDKKSESTNQP